jgi:hypothetical protein
MARAAGCAQQQINMSKRPEPGPGVRVFGERPSIAAAELPAAPYENEAYT